MPGKSYPHSATNSGDMWSSNDDRVMDITRYDMSEQAISAAQTCVGDLLRRRAGTPVLLLVSGGSALGILDDLRAPSGAWLTIGVLDERLSRDPTINNFLQFEGTGFFRRLINGGAQVLGTLPGESESMEALAARWEQALRIWRTVNPDGSIIVTAGMGPDGHTAGIFPFSEDADAWTRRFCSDRWVVGYDVTGKSPYPFRVTTTATFLRTQVDHVCLLITGKEKCAALGRLCAETGAEAATPARVLRSVRDVRVFTDIQE